MRQSRFNRNLPTWVLLACGLLMLLVTININWGKDHWKQIIRSDAEGYYAYLPAVIVFQDLNFEFFEPIEKYKYHDPFNYYDYRLPVKGVHVNKYYCGTAIAELPFFMVAHAWAYIDGSDMDGYSRPYMLMMSLAAIFYLLLGLVFLNALLKTFEIKPWVRALVIPAILFGTNLFYYSVGEPGLSHVFSFAFCSLFLLLLKKYLTNRKPILLLYLALSLGIIVLIRPVNALIIFALPFLSADYRDFLNFFKRLLKDWRYLIPSVIIFGILCFIQLIIHRIATGYFLIWSYGNEHFDFTSFHMHDFLISYKKGFFLYTPLALISLAGIWWVGKKSLFSAGGFLFFFVLLIWVLSSWWNWWYGGSFSSRVMVEYLPLFAVLLAVLIQAPRAAWIRYLAIFLIGLSVLLCQVQTYQYRYHRIHWENMDKAQYWDVFLRIDRL